MQNNAGWPPTSYEKRPWTPSGEEIASRRERMRARGDYRTAVLAPIAEVTPNLDAAILALADDASRELTRFDAEAGSIATPFAAILLRSESASSSEVENLSSSAKQVALAEIGAAKSPNAKLIVANVRAMQAALELADDINETSIIAMHSALLEESAPHFVGNFREEQVWIGGGRISPHGADFVAPHHDRVDAYMRDLVAFTHRTDLPVLIQVALTHAQFETIHPFSDGNGRTGRALIHSMLRHGGITRNITVPVSAGLLNDTSSYFDALTKFREGDPHPIIERLVEASFSAVENGRTLVAELSRSRQEWDEIIQARRGSTADRMKELLLKQPVVSAQIISRELTVSEVAAQRAIDQFTEAGILKQTNSWKRNRIWHCQDTLDALDRFADRARRKRG